MDGNVGMTRDTLAVLIGRMLDAETRAAPRFDEVRNG